MPKVKTSWKPGVSGNPAGRPLKGYSITETAREMLNAKPEIKRALVTKVLERALKNNDIVAIKLLWSYMDGQAPQEIINTDKKILIEFENPHDKKKV